MGTTIKEWGPPTKNGDHKGMGTTKEWGPLWHFWPAWPEVMGIGSVNGDHQQRMGTTCGWGTLVGFLASLDRGDGDRLSKWGPPTKSRDHCGMGTPVGFLASLDRGDGTGSVNGDFVHRMGTNVEWGPLWDFWRA